MQYKLIFHPEIENDLAKFSKIQTILVYKQFKKIATSPELGKLLGNMNGYDLSGCRKMYVDKKQIRIIYKIVDDAILVEVVAIGKREDMQVYAKAAQRL